MIILEVFYFNFCWSNTEAFITSLYKINRLIEEKYLQEILLVIKIMELELLVLAKY